MCQFCVEHGEGERWYLNTANYAHDLASDLDRRGYIIDFISGFGERRQTAIDWMRRLDALPVPLSRLGKSAISSRMQKNHFGQPVPIEECKRILAMSTSITVIPCICRMHAPGKRADEVCMLVTTQPIEAVLQEGFADYADGPDLSQFNRMSREDALALLTECEREGLMHSVWTFKTPFTAAICNCNLESGCLAMRMTAGHGLKLMWRGEWVALLDDDRCVNCGACVSACPFEAISRDRTVRVHAERCWGCGVCRAFCRHGALRLADRRSVPAVSTLW